jgi:hypothetical protein
VVVPSVLARVKEAELSSREWIAARSKVALEAITVRAGRSQVGRGVEALIVSSYRVMATRGAWDDVVNLDLPADNATVLATVAGSLLDGFFFAR